MESTAKDLIVNAINNTRAEAEVPGFICCSYEQSMEYISTTTITLDEVLFDLVFLEALTDDTSTQLTTIITQQIADNLKFQNLILSRDFTHIDSQFVVADNEQQAALKITLFSRFLEIEPPGQVIDGDLVVQGSTCITSFESPSNEKGPALCIVGFAKDHDESFRDVLVVYPWQMMFAAATHSDADGVGNPEHSLHSFAIPIQLPSELKGEAGSVRVRVFVDDVANIPYEEEAIDFDSSPDRFVCAIEINTQSIDSSSVSRQASPRANKTTPSAVDNTSFDADEKNYQDNSDMDSKISGLPTKTDPEIASIITNKVKPGDKLEFVDDIKIAFDYDELQSFVAEGLDSNAVHLTSSGPTYETEHMWKFHILSSHKAGVVGDSDYYGLEDVIWIKTLKAMGSLPSIPNFEVIDTDLLSTEDSYSVFLAVRRGPNPRYKNITVVTCPIDIEDQLKPFVVSRRSVFRQAPVEVCKAMGVLCGIALEWLDELGDVGADVGVKPASSSAERRERKDSKSGSGDRSDNRTRSNAGDLFERNGSSGSSNVEVGNNDVYSEDGSDDEDEGEEKVSIEVLEDRLAALQEEKEELLQSNYEFQRRAALLIAREKMNQGQSNVAKTPEAAAQQALLDAEINLDFQQDKQKQYQEGLLQIIEGKRKYAKQMREFDQLAADLQARLDDKEFKATEITESFRKFKRDILKKSVNSKTGLTLSDRIIQQIIETEQRREEDLEKVRLRNISLRSGLKKLDRALRAKEQLAEGLHMIDFEQLKIENTALSEKIEERNEELNKLKRKRALTLQMLTHIREKLRHTTKGNDRLKAEVTALEAAITDHRYEVTSSKRDRDLVKAEVNELKRAQGFTTSDLLLVDYENRKSQLMETKASVREYKNRYEILTQQVEKGNRTLNNSGNYPNSPYKSPTGKGKTIFN